MPNIERLKQGLRVLCEVRDQKKAFNLAGWMNDINDDGVFPASGEAPECGYVCCAIGWMMQDPWHNQQGLKGSGFASGSCPTFGSWAGWEAVKLYFDIDQERALHLFTSENYDENDQTTIEDVIERLEKFIARCECQQENTNA